MTNNALEKDLPTPPDKLFDTLQEIDISYKIYEHEPVFTVSESEKLDRDIPGTHCRNLFLRDKKKQNFLIVAANQTQIDLKKAQELIGCGRLSFGSPERLWEHLGIRPGSVCPFTAINDPNHHVQIILDKFMMDSDLVNYHPLDNSMTISITPTDLLKFFDYTGHKPQILAF